MFAALRAFLLCLAAVSSSHAAPWSTFVQHSTHSARSLPNGLTLKTYHPKSTFEVYERGVPHPLSGRAEKASFTDAGMAFLHSKLGDGMSLRSGFESSHASHVYAVQKINDIPVANAVTNVVMNTKGDVVSFSSNFVKLNSFAPVPSSPKLSKEDAVAAAVQQLEGRHLGEEPELAYLALEDGKMALTHSVRLELRHDGHWVDAYVDAETGDVVGMVDYTTELSMRVVPISRADPTDGFQLLSDSDIVDPKASPSGWTTFQGENKHATIGNNIVAFKANLTAAVLPASDPATDTFDAEFDPTTDPTTDTNVAAAFAQAFYAANTAHDILYRYGWTESAFNFQQDGTGGTNGDPVLLSVQDVTDFNNANFVTLAEVDGKPGLMRMFLFNVTTPFRDGDMVNGVVLHEYAHGLTNRLTGGGNAKCLQTIESGGLGEGWSDAFADWVAQTANGGHVANFITGEWLNPTGHGIRDFPYSHSRAVNPYTYSTVKQFNEVHKIGQIWAQVLHIVHGALVQTLGSADDALTNPDAENGHTVFLHLMIDALSIQPCNPTFPDARLAWIQADQNRYDGKNRCNLWLAFAYMGLGVDAADFVDSHKVPEGCPLQYAAPA
ncbi:putative extracellular elastinolytic metallo proteinase precursor [Exidia glandulosa HHB12029]|uniref:Extracellular metalloproteinase n=1 Tax=Exidia glandulosa HHB12029 TaxID=1314781 RepID=A0A165PLF6_EXIGL|nr:putative extracellular elastinolytic metallo proteinase precursor [Exidia glandulosa HHB12029]